MKEAYNTGLVLAHSEWRHQECMIIMCRVSISYDLWESDSDETRMISAVQWLWLKWLYVRHQKYIHTSLIANSQGPCMHVIDNTALITQLLSAILSIHYLIGPRHGLFLQHIIWILQFHNSHAPLVHSMCKYNPLYSLSRHKTHLVLSDWTGFTSLCITP